MLSAETFSVGRLFPRYFDFIRQCVRFSANETTQGSVRVSRPAICNTYQSSGSEPRVFAVSREPLYVATMGGGQLANVSGGRDVYPGTAIRRTFRRISHLDWLVLAARGRRPIRFRQHPTRCNFRQRTRCNGLSASAQRREIRGTKVRRATTGRAETCGEIRAAKLRA